MPRRRWGISTDGSGVTAADWRLPYAMQSDDDIDWPIHSLVLSFKDLGGLLLRRLRPNPQTGWSPPIGGDAKFA